MGDYYSYVKDEEKDSSEVTRAVTKLVTELGNYARVFATTLGSLSNVC